MLLLLVQLVDQLILVGDLVVHVAERVVVLGQEGGAVAGLFVCSS